MNETPDPAGSTQGTLSASASIQPPERQMAVFTHLSALFGLVFPFGSIIGPLVFWLIKKDTMPFVDDQGKEALNFNITVAIAGIICCFLFLVIIGWFLMIALVVVWFIFVIFATIKASEGVAYRYPLTLRIIQ